VKCHMGSQHLKLRQQAKQNGLVGLTLNTFDPIFVDVAARFGFDIVWIEMEHSCITMREAEQLCRMISGVGMLSLIRLPNGARDVALKAAETGVDMLMVPMINNPTELEQFVAHTRYAPDGQRGFYRYSRAMNYGLGDTVVELRRQANENLMLWGQIETLSALDRLPELCQVDGIDGLFMGPGDLSSAYGVPGQLSDQRVVDAVSTGVATSQLYQKCTGTVARVADAKRWIEQSVDVLFVGGNVEFYVKAAESLKSQLEGAMNCELGVDARQLSSWSFNGRIDRGHDHPARPAMESDPAVDGSVANH
jgi:4-hydroxy-2-oxoheptanedioate aldolase